MRPAPAPAAHTLCAPAAHASHSLHSITSSLVTSLVTSQPLILCYQARNAAWLETRSTKRSMQRSTKRAPRFERDAQLTRTRFARNEAHASSETRPTLRARHATKPPRTFRAKHAHASSERHGLAHRQRMQRTRCDTSGMAIARSAASGAYVSPALNHTAHLRAVVGATRGITCFAFHSARFTGRNEARSEAQSEA